MLCLADLHDEHTGNDIEPFILIMMNVSGWTALRHVPMFEDEQLAVGVAARELDREGDEPPDFSVVLLESIFTTLNDSGVDGCLHDVSFEYLPSHAEIVAIDCQGNRNGRGGLAWEKSAMRAGWHRFVFEPVKSGGLGVNHPHARGTWRFPWLRTGWDTNGKGWGINLSHRRVQRSARLSGWLLNRELPRFFDDDLWPARVLLRLRAALFHSTLEMNILILDRLGEIATERVIELLPTLLKRDGNKPALTRAGELDVQHLPTRTPRRVEDVSADDDVLADHRLDGSGVFDIDDDILRLIAARGESDESQSEKHREKPERMFDVHDAIVAGRWR